MENEHNFKSKIYNNFLNHNTHEMSKSIIQQADSASPPPIHSDFHARETTSWLLTAFFPIVFPVVVAAVLYQLDGFEPVHIPAHELSRRTLTAPARNKRMMRGSELLGRDTWQDLKTWITTWRHVSFTLGVRMGGSNESP